MSDEVGVRDVDVGLAIVDVVAGSSGV